MHSLEYDEAEGRKGWNGDTDTLEDKRINEGTGKDIS